jgi:WD40 repeat protein
MFELYNAVLRAWANDADRGVVPTFSAVAPGLHVCDRFTSTLHAINSGVVKLSQLTPAIVVYRGISGMKLPAPFLAPSKFNVRGGVEYGFMSTTLDQRVALRYATSGAGEPSTLMVMQMGMVDRGAQLDWLSQYPEEKEILLPPLTGMEVLEDDVSPDDVRKLTMRLNINLRSTTLEQLLAARQKELGELAHVVHKDLGNRNPEGDIPRRLAAVSRLEHEIQMEDHVTFNDNGVFVRMTEAVLGQLPRCGDQLEVLRTHSGPIFALSAAGGDADANALLVSGSWDGSTSEFGRHVGVQDSQRWVTTQHDSPVLAVEVLPSVGLIAVGRFNKTIGLMSAGESGVQQLVHHSGGVTALAWLSERNWLASGSVDTDVIVWDLSSPSHAVQPPQHWVLSGHDDTVRALCWLEDRQWLASGSLDGTARVWQPTQAGFTLVAPLDEHHGPITSVVVCCTTGGEPCLATASADRSIIVWEVETMRSVVKAPGCHQLGVCALAWLPAQRWLASGSADTTIKLWQLPDANGKTLQIAHTLRGHTDSVHALAVIQSRGWLASASSDNSVRLWRV